MIQQDVEAGSSNDEAAGGSNEEEVSNGCNEEASNEGEGSNDSNKEASSITTANSLEWAMREGSVLDGKSEETLGTREWYWSNAKDR